MTKRQQWVMYWASQDDVEGYFEEYAELRRREREQEEHEFQQWRAQQDWEMQEQMRRFENEYFALRDEDSAENEPMRQPNRMRKFLIHKVKDYASRHRQTRRKLRGGPPARLLLTDGRDHRS